MNNINDNCLKNCSVHQVSLLKTAPLQRFLGVAILNLTLIGFVNLGNVAAQTSSTQPAPESNLHEPSTRVLNERELWGIALSRDGRRLAFASTANVKGEDSEVLISTSNTFDNFRKLDLPRELVWMDPSFSHDGTRLVLAASCRDPSKCEVENHGWSIWTYDLKTDARKRVTEPLPGFIRWKPIFAEDGGIAYINLSNLASFSESIAIGWTFLSHVKTDGSESIFPGDIVVNERSVRRRGFGFLAREVAFKCKRLLGNHPRKGWC